MRKEIFKIEEVNEIKQEDIRDIEKKYNCKLPNDYINFLEFQNGAILNKNLIKGYEEDIWIESISGINGLEINNVLPESDYFISEWELPNKLLLIYGEGHWWISFDYRNLNPDNTPKISYIDLELNRDIVIANSFTELLELLYSK